MTAIGGSTSRTRCFSNITDCMPIGCIRMGSLFSGKFKRRLNTCRATPVDGGSWVILGVGDGRSGIRNSQTLIVRPGAVSPTYRLMPAHLRCAGRRSVSIFLPLHSFCSNSARRERRHGGRDSQAAAGDSFEDRFPKPQMQRSFFPDRVKAWCRQRQVALAPAPTQGADAKPVQGSRR